MTLEKKLIELLNLHNRNRIDYNTRKWETIKFFQTIISALLGAVVYAIISMYKLSEWDLLVLRIPLASLSLIIAFASIYAIKNLRRESELLYLEELQMFKITKYLGLDLKLEKIERWLPDDEYLLLDKWRLNNFGTGDKNPQNTKEWLQARIKGHRFLGIFNYVFIIEFITAILLFIIILFNPEL